ncbi:MULTISPECIES: PIN domain-containing protein [unclassified Bradyrhizobium]|uniref:PIN domain-containing protein n=1 Tax=unclassified Bradyrhizobium TaxID=2631580 RepID=UPI002915E76F|nr:MULTISPECIES: DUF4411 family protein [unclassified Bradyrhizobium]
MYVFDNSPFSALFRNYYRKQFPSLWTKFDQMIANKLIISTREVLREIEDGSLADLADWAKQNQDIFPTPTNDEGQFVTKIFSVPHFQANIERQKFYKGGRNADPFVIAKAGTDGLTVVTMEKFKKGAAKIPNICDHFKVPCFTLEDFMAAEGWTF